MLTVCIENKLLSHDPLHLGNSPTTTSSAKLQGMGLFWEWAIANELILRVGYSEWAYFEGGPQGMGLFWGWATGNGLILRVGHREWAYFEDGGDYSMSLIHPASNSPTPDHSCPPQMHEGHPNPSSVPTEWREETRSHPWWQSTWRTRPEPVLQTYEKMKLRSSQGSNMGLLDAGQMLLPTEPLKLWYWGRGCLHAHRYGLMFWLDLCFPTLHGEYQNSWNQCHPT